MAMTCSKDFGIFNEVTGPVQYVFKDKPETYSTTTYIIINTREPSYFSLTSIEQVRFVLHFYGFTKTELASIIGISRPALYAWLDGTSEPTGENHDKLSKLAQLAHDIQPVSSTPLFHGFIDRPVPGYEKSLLEYLSDNGGDDHTISALIRKIHLMSKERRARLDTMPKAKYPEQGMIEDNLSSLEKEGY